MKRARFLPSVLAVLLHLAPAALRAEATEPLDAARAEALFEEGRQALAAGDYLTACAKFEESQRLDPGAGTLLNRATCEEKLGNDQRALQHFREALELLAPEDDRVPFAEARIAELEARAAAPPAPAPAPAPNAAPEVRRGQEEGAGPPLLAWTLVGVGTAGLVTGITTSVLVTREQDLVDRHCEDKLCDETGLEAAERGHTLLWINAAAYGLGAAALGTGLALLLTRESEEAPRRAPAVRAGVVPGGGFVGYGGRF